jgi:hypothetical protein
MIFYTGTTTKKMQIKDILSKTRVPTNFQSVSVDNITCEASRKNTIHYYLILKKPLNIDQEFLIRNHTSSFIKVIDLQKVSTYEDTNYIKYKITLQRNSCVKRWVEILQEFFEYYGIQEFFIKEFRY